MKTTKSVELKSAPRLGALNMLAKYCYDAAAAKGFHLKSPSIPTYLMNLTGEISELWEAYRAGDIHAPCDKAAKMIEAGTPVLSCLEEELADIQIRLLDTSHAFGVDMDRAVDAKLRFNATREFKHGGKVA